MIFLFQRKTWNLVFPHYDDFDYYYCYYFGIRF